MIVVQLQPYAPAKVDTGWEGLEKMLEHNYWHDGLPLDTGSKTHLDPHGLTGPAWLAMEQMLRTVSVPWGKSLLPSLQQ